MVAAPTLSISIVRQCSCSYSSLKLPNRLHADRSCEGTATRGGEAGPSRVSKLLSSL